MWSKLIAMTYSSRDSHSDLRWDPGVWIFFKGWQVFFFFNFYWNIVALQLVSTIHQNESAICIYIYIYISPLFWISFPFWSPQNIKDNSLCCTIGSSQLSALYTVSVMSIPISQFLPPTPFPLGVHTFVFCICVSISPLQIGSSVPFF